jgi:tetratricopeptide (TPR) repeat protein
MHDSNTTWWRVGIGHALTILMTLAFVAAPTSQAVALDKDEIVQMSKLDLDKEAIKGAIDSAGETLDLSEVEVGELRAQGVSDEIIQYLKDNGHVAGAKKEGDQKEKTAEDESSSDGKDQGEEPAPAGDEDTAQEKAEADESDGQDQDGVGGAQPPAPAPGEEGETKEMTQEEIEELREEARKEGQEELKEEEKRQRKLQRAARRLPDAKDKLSAGNNMEAARMFLRFLSLEPREGSDNWYEAKFGLAKALYNEGILSGAATPTQQVVMAGADRPHFQEAFRILQDLTRKIGYQPPALEELTKVLTRDLPQDFLNDFNYYLGKFFYDYNRNKLAVKYLKKVKEGSDDYPKALYLMGVAQLDPSIDDKPAALENFERAIRAGEKAEEQNEEILQLGYLALARVFYEVGLYDVALYYYQKIPRDSARHAEAMFEKAWTYFQKNDLKRALGTFHTLDSPYYEQWYFPDLHILEATVYLNLCQFDYSKRALAEFTDRYLDKRPRLKEFLNETTEPKAYWNKMTTAYKKDGVTSSGELPEMFVNAVLDDLEFYNVYKTVRLLKKERKALKNNIDALGDFGEEVLDRVNQQVNTKVEEGGILVRQKLSEIDQELGKWDRKATEISFDIDSEEKSEMEQRLQSRETKDGEEEAGTTLLIVADDWQPWPFEGEYWFDEVANYRSRQSSKCTGQ